MTTHDPAAVELPVLLLTGATDGEKIATAAASAAVIDQNVYLYCASAGPATVFCGSVPGAALAKRLKLPPGQIIQFAPTVGYPKT